MLSPLLPNHRQMHQLGPLLYPLLYTLVRLPGRLCVLCAFRWVILQLKPLEAACPLLSWQDIQTQW